MLTMKGKAGGEGKEEPAALAPVPSLDANYFACPVIRWSHRRWLRLVLIGWLRRYRRAAWTMAGGDVLSNRPVWVPFSFRLCSISNIIFMQYASFSVQPPPVRWYNLVGGGGCCRPLVSLHFSASFSISRLFFLAVSPTPSLWCGATRECRFREEWLV